jgi:arginase
MPQKIRIIGVPMDLGQSRRGVDMGPSALRVAGLLARLKQLGHQVDDIGNVAVKQPEEQHFGEKHAKYLREIAETCRGLAEITEHSLEEGFFPLVLGGDHSLAAGSGSGIASFFRKKEKRVMPLAALIGHGPPDLVDLCGFRPKIEPRNVVLVGVRELDAKERRLIKDSGVHVFTMRDVDERGMREVMADAIRIATDDDSAGAVVSLDLDFVDPSDAPGVGTPVRGGVTYREAHLALEMIADSETMVSLEVVEINPVIDEHNKTALLAVELILSGLGKKIL